MIIEIESVYGDKLIHGKYLEQNKLQSSVKELLLSVGERNFVSAFCAQFGYDPIAYNSNIKIDYTIDLDTHLVIKPKY